jgi:hypothetical protein
MLYCSHKCCSVQFLISERICCFPSGMSIRQLFSWHANGKKLIQPYLYVLSWISFVCWALMTSRQKSFLPVGWTKAKSAMTFHEWLQPTARPGSLLRSRLRTRKSFVAQHGLSTICDWQMGLPWPMGRSNRKYFDSNRIQWNCHTIVI